MSYRKHRRHTRRPATTTRRRQPSTNRRLIRPLVESTRQVPHRWASHPTSLVRSASRSPIASLLACSVVIRRRRLADPNLVLTDVQRAAAGREAVVRVAVVRVSVVRVAVVRLPERERVLEFVLEFVLEAEPDSEPEAEAN